jgi:glycerate-2-kinase
VSSPRGELEALFRTALRAVEPGPAVRRAIERDGPRLFVAGVALPGDARCVVLALGKAAAAMAAAFASEAGERVARGLIVTRDAHGGDPVPRHVLREAGHPLPDARSEAAGTEALALAASAKPNETLVVLLSGGSSALTSCPQPGVGLEALRETTDLLLRAGAEIEELNCIRKHLTRVSGGRLAAATRAGAIVVLAISDVLRDDWATLGSGPCAADPSTYRDALAVLRRRRVADRVPAAVRRHLEAGAAGRHPESVKPGDPALARVRSELIASNRDALAAARDAARARGLAACIVTHQLRGEASRVGRRVAALAQALGRGPRRLLLLGGETTVTVRGGGRGGRAQELALGAAIALAGDARVALLAAGTDGSDGPTPAAGAYADGETVGRGAAAGLDARAALAENDAYGFFAGEGGCFVTGPTGTNVMDLVLVRVADYARVSSPRRGPDRE